MDKKLFVVLSLVIVICSVTDSFAVSGSWTRQIVGPNIYLEGVSHDSRFDPMGTIPPNSIITAISWNWSFYNERTDTQVFIGNSVLGFADISGNNSGIDMSFFDGGNPNSSIFLLFEVPGNGTVSPTMLGKLNTVSVSWKTVEPESTPISGPNSVEIGNTIELDGTVEYATNYTWSTIGGCSIVGASDENVATVRGVINGQCTVSREACDAYNNCVSNTHSVEVTGTLLLTPMFHLLLLQ